MWKLQRELFLKRWGRKRTTLEKELKLQDKPRWDAPQGTAQQRLWRPGEGPRQKGGTGGSACSELCSERGKRRVAGANKEDLNSGLLN